LVINHIIRAIWPLPVLKGRWIGGIMWAKRFVVFVAVVVAWVLFRSDSVGTAATVLSAMAGQFGRGHLPPRLALAWFLMCFVIVWAFPTPTESFPALVFRTDRVRSRHRRRDSWRGGRHRRGRWRPRLLSSPESSPSRISARSCISGSDGRRIRDPVPEDMFCGCRGPPRSRRGLQRGRGPVWNSSRNIDRRLQRP